MSPANPTSAPAAPRRASPFRALVLAVAAAALLQMVRTGATAFTGDGTPGPNAALSAGTGLPQGMVCTSCGPIATGEALAPLGALPRIGVAEVSRRPDPTGADAVRPPLRTPSIDQP
ncbi:MAG TPA: hypothetical protein VEQ85_12440 [Lacipirellulaceae bacterium]|nr:hypothetical protein [Lacipirellulaceae bacterium]